MMTGQSFRTITLSVPVEREDSFREIFQVTPPYLAVAVCLASAFRGAFDPADRTLDLLKAQEIARAILPGREAGGLNETRYLENVTFFEAVRQAIDAVSSITPVPRVAPPMTAAGSDEPNGPGLVANMMFDRGYLSPYLISKTRFIRDFVFAVQEGDRLTVTPFSLEVAVTKTGGQERLTAQDHADYSVRVKAVSLDSESHDWLDFDVKPTQSSELNAQKDFVEELNLLSDKLDQENELMLQILKAKK
ncbi:hypothetical protein [Streptomyces sp. NPDC001933]|uniref:hypothetical protein n=1 Tax=Streptomyces sp. NPDC001933 TaxID=3364626 RepID=UPI0036C9EE7D